MFTSHCLIDVIHSMIHVIFQVLFMRDGVFIHTQLNSGDEDTLVEGSIFLLQKVAVYQSNQQSKIIYI